MALFGKMVDKTPVPAPIDPEVPLNYTDRRRMFHQRRAAERRAEEEKSEASAFSDAFGWANLKFEKLFKFRENTCAHKYLKDFWATTGTFISALFGSGGFRVVLDFITKKLFAVVSGDLPKDPAPGMEPGAHELHIVKTSYLGICQAMGSLLCVAKYSGCPCGWLNDAMWSIAIMWLFCMPVGTLILLSWNMYRGSENGDLEFEKNPGSSWAAFFEKVGAVKSEKGAEEFAHPRVVHGILKFFLATIGALLNLLGLRSTMTYTSFACEMKFVRSPFYCVHPCGPSFSWGEDETCAQAGPEMFVFWLVGTFLIILSGMLSSKHGRKFVLALTNSISKSIGVEYRMHDETLVIKAWHTPTPGVRGQPGEMGSVGKMLTFVSDMSARFSALTDPQYQNALRNRGKWKKKDTYAMFYGEYNHNGMLWAMFLMFKSLLVGVLLTSCEVSMCSVPCPCGDAEFKVRAPLVSLDGKVWTIAMMYVTEFGILVFFNPDSDLFNGYKMAFQQMQQSIIMLIAALTATDKITASEGAAALVMLGTIQVALAMPEQIMGVIKNFILKKGDKTQAPDFAMTASELDLKEELAVGMEKKLNHAKDLVKKVMDMKPLMLAGEVEEVFRCILLCIQKLGFFLQTYPDHPSTSDVLVGFFPGI